MKINVSDAVIGHFWEEPPEDSWEFWAFIWPVKAKVGDTIFFYYNKKLIAQAVIAKIEKPGESECEGTGNYRNRWKVYWRQESFVDMREIVTNYKNYGFEIIKDGGKVNKELSKKFRKHLERNKELINETLANILSDYLLFNKDTSDERIAEMKLKIKTNSKEK